MTKLNHEKVQAAKIAWLAAIDRYGSKSSEAAAKGAAYKALLAAR